MNEEEVKVENPVPETSVPPQVQDTQEKQKAPEFIRSEIPPVNAGQMQYQQSQVPPQYRQNMTPPVNVGQMQYQQNPVPQRQQAGGLSIAGMVLGIISIVICFCSGGLGLICGIVALVFSIVEKVRGMNHPITITGLVCSIIGTCLSLLVVVTNFVYYL